MVAKEIPDRQGANADPFELLGLRAFINCCGSRTVYGGSRMAPEVVQAMVAAASRFVNVPQLLDAAGKRIAELLGAPAALITSGGSGALFVGAAGAATGGDPERIVRLPRIDWPQRHIVMPRGGRFSYDHAMRASGLEIVEAGTRDEMAHALDSAALVAVLGTFDPQATMKLEDCVALARPRGIPVLVDAASEYPRNPDPYLARGASMVAYSGGKYLRGPQSTGILLGEATWIAAAALNTAPHTGIGRHLKVSKEEIAGLVAAVELWIGGRDTAQEEQTYRNELGITAAAAEKCRGVTTEIFKLSGPEEPTPRLRVTWDRGRIDVDGPTLRARLAAGDPSVQVDDRFALENSIVVLPFNLQPGEALIVGQRIAAELGAAPARAATEPAPSSLADVTGSWEVRVSMTGGDVVHAFDLRQQGAAVTGMHRMRALANPISGKIAGVRIELASFHPIEGDTLAYRFMGEVGDGAMHGLAELGTTAPTILGPVNKRQYGEVRWVAQRR